MEDHIAQFETLFDTYGDAIFRHLHYRLGNRERAKELTQEVFMRVWQHMASGKEIVHKKAFLYRIAHNLFVNEIRTDRSTQSLDTEHSEGVVADVSREGNPSSFSEKQELLGFLEQLPDSYKEVLVLRYIDDLAVKDIAELLNEKETTISMRIQRATEKLKTLYHL